MDQQPQVAAKPRFPESEPRFMAITSFKCPTCGCVLGFPLSSDCARGDCPDASAAHHE